MPNLVYFFCHHNVEPKNEMATSKFLLLDFLKTSNLSFLGGQKFQIERLEKTCGGSIPGGSWENPASFLCWIFSRRPI